VTPPTVQFIPAAAAGSDYTDYMIAGTSYWIVPDGTGSTATISGPTGGDSSATWNSIQKKSASGVSVVTSQAGTVVMSSSYPYVIWGGFNQLSNPYQFLATWCDGTGGFHRPQTPGWIVFESETVPGTATGFRQTFAPIEVQSGVVGGSITAAGYAPQWNDTGKDNSLVFFFNSYTPGDVQGWTAWDGTTTP